MDVTIDTNKHLGANFLFPYPFNKNSGIVTEVVGKVKMSRRNQFLFQLEIEISIIIPVLLKTKQFHPKMELK